MTYSSIYCALISKRLQNPISKDDEYCEAHHIIPRSEGGEDCKENLVNLTAREHYVAHLLLEKIYKDNKMSCAVWFMSNSKNVGLRNYKVSSRSYERQRKHFSSIAKTWIHYKISDATRAKMSKAHIGNKSALGSVRSKETRQKISESKMGCKNPNYGKHFSYEHRMKIAQACMGHGKAIQQFSKDGKHIADYETITSASNKLGIIRTSIVNCLRGSSKTSGGFIWRYKE